MARECVEISCDRSAACKGRCDKHYRMYRRGATVRKCEWRDCEGEASGRAMTCPEHTGLCVVNDGASWCGKRTVYSDGGNSWARAYCPMHLARRYQKGSFGPVHELDTRKGYARIGEWRTDKNGYVYRKHVSAEGVVRQEMQHRLVMEEQIGRPLLPEETVHHINGVRDDNRPENLELWSSSHPKGQRVEDKVAWAKELLRQYEPEALVD